jgi:tellurite resistance protein TerC
MPEGELMDVPLWVWLVTVAGFVVLLGLDLFLARRRPHAVEMREAAIWVAGAVTLAIGFGLGLGVLENGNIAQQFFAGYLTEYSLSVDNLFVFVVIMTAFAVPRVQQPQALLIGIVVALVLRGVFIAVGAAAIERFSATFFVFGAFLLYTAVQVARSHGDTPSHERNAMIRLATRVLPTTDEYHDGRLLTRIDGKRVVTPLFLVMLAIGTTDLIFALDSIPAIYGLTEEPYIVFTANAFALMALRQLYFLLHGLLDRLVYLSYGLAVILAFIGVKLVLHASHEQWGKPWPEIGTPVSLAVIIGTLVITVVLSLWANKRARHQQPHSEPSAAEAE